MSERIGQYELLEKFAEGGMAEVYFARFVGVEGFRRECAIKRLLPEYTRKTTVVDMFLDEARLAASLLHPNIVQVFDLGETRGQYFMAMELVDGPHVGRLFAHSLRIGRPLPLEICAWLIAQAADGLHHAHTRVDPIGGRTLGIVHRDMSPQNVLVSRWGDVKITDFGIAKMRERRSRTRTGVLKGKLGYLSPEQCLGRPLDRRSDVFALGVMLYELLTRRRLYKNGVELEVMQRITSEEPLPPSVRNPEVDSVLGDIALRALRKEPDQRFQSAAELGDALSAWLGRRGVADVRAALSFWVRTHAGEIWQTPEERAQRWQSQSHETMTVDKKPKRAVMQLRRPAIDLPTTSFIGRRAFLRDLDRRLQQGDRWLSLIGPAGVGKSRVVLQFLHEEGERWRDSGGAWRVDLTGVDSASGVCITVARHLNVPLVGVADERIAARIGSALAARDRLLLVLDQVDQAAQQVSGLLRAWLRRAPQLQLVVIGRERTGSADEQVIDVPPMSLPIGDQVSGSEAVLLFAARAASARPGFRVGQSDPTIICNLVRQLDGLPLALEFAAARLAVLEPADLLARLDRRFELLGGPGERSSLRDALSESWDGLHVEARDALIACIPFRGGFNVSAAEAVVGADALRILDILRNHSLLRTRPDAIGGAARFDLLHSIRAFAEDNATPEALATAARRQATHFGARAGEWLLGQHRRGGAAAARRLLQERSNLGIALSWYAKHGRALSPDAQAGDRALDLAESLLFGDRRDGDHAAREHTLGQAESAGAAGPRLKRSRAVLLLEVGRVGEARRSVEQALRQAIGPNSEAERTKCLLLLARVSRRQGALAEAETCARQALASAERIDDKREGLGFEGELVGRSLAAIGRVHLERGDGQVAVEHLERAADALRMSGDLPREAAVRAQLGRAYLNLHRLRDADTAIEAALVSSQQRGATANEAQLMWLQARLYLERGDDDGAMSALRSAEAGARSGEDTVLAMHIRLADALRHLLSGRHDRALARLDAALGDTTHISRRQRLRRELLLAHTCALSGDLPRAEAACRAAQSWLSDDRDAGRWAELALAVAALERAQAAAGADAAAADRASERVQRALPAANERSQWLRLTVTLYQQSWNTP